MRRVLALIFLYPVILPLIWGCVVILRCLTRSGTSLIEMKNDDVLLGKNTHLFRGVSYDALIEINNWLADHEVAVTEETAKVLETATLYLERLEEIRQDMVFFEQQAAIHFPRLATRFSYEPDIAIAIEDDIEFAIFRLRWAS